MKFKIGKFLKKAGEGALAGAGVSLGFDAQVGSPADPGRAGLVALIGALYKAAMNLYRFYKDSKKEGDSPSKKWNGGSHG